MEYSDRITRPSKAFVRSETLAGAAASGGSSHYASPKEAATADTSLQESDPKQWHEVHLCDACARPGIFQLLSLVRLCKSNSIVLLYPSPVRSQARFVAGPTVGVQSSQGSPARAEEAHQSDAILQVEHIE